MKATNTDKKDTKSPTRTNEAQSQQASEEQRLRFNKKMF